MARGAKKSGKKKRKKGSAGKRHATPAEVIEVIGRVGTKQGGSQVRCKLTEGREKGKVMRRNVLGPVREGDILLLRETEIEASPMRGSRR